MLSFPLPLPIVLLLMGGVMQLPHERVHSGAFSWHILLQVSQWPLPLLWLTLRVEQLPPHFFGILKINERVIQWRFMANTFGVNWAQNRIQYSRIIYTCVFVYGWNICLHLVKGIGKNSFCIYALYCHIYNRIMFPRAALLKPRALQYVNKCEDGRCIQELL